MFGLFGVELIGAELVLALGEGDVGQFGRNGYGTAHAAHGTIAAPCGGEAIHQFYFELNRAAVAMAAMNL